VGIDRPSPAMAFRPPLIASLVSRPARAGLKPFAVCGGTVLVFLLAGAAARADSEPVIVIPGHLGVPVIINGIDASGAVVFGDWGLSRPGHGAVVIEGGGRDPRGPRRLHYFPATGKPPNYGRDEIQTPPSRRGASTDFHRSWSAGPGAEPATIPPGVPPVVIFDPRSERDRPKPPQPPRTGRP